MCLIGYKHIINGSNALQPHRLWPARLLSRQEFWSGYPLPSPRDLPTQRPNPGFLHCRQILFPFPWALQECSLTTSGFPKELTQRPSVQFSSVSQSCPTLWEPVDCSSQTSLSITNSWSLLKFMSRELVMPSSHLILCHPFSSCLQSFPASGSFPMNQFFASGGQSTGASVWASRLNIQDRFPLGWTGLISLQSKGLSRVFSNTTVQKHQFCDAQLSS